jgi:hypothetical protein
MGWIVWSFFKLRNFYTPGMVGMENKKCWRLESWNAVDCVYQCFGVVGLRNLLKIITRNYCKQYHFYPFTGITLFQVQLPKKE